MYEDFLTRKEVDALRAQCHKIVDEMDPKEHKPTVFSTVKRVYNFVDLESVWFILLTIFNGKVCWSFTTLKEYYEIVGESRPLSAFFPKHADLFTEMRL